MGQATLTFHTSNAPAVPAEVEGDDGTNLPRQQKAPAVPSEVEGDVVLQKQTPTGEAPAVLTDGAW